MEYAIGYAFLRKAFFMISRKYFRLSISEKADCGICYRVHVSEKVVFDVSPKVLPIKRFRESGMWNVLIRQHFLGNTKNDFLRNVYPIAYSTIHFLGNA